MRSDELVTNAREAAFIPDTHPDYTNAKTLKWLNNTFANVFGAIVSESGGMAWLKQYITPTVASSARYRIPARALVGGLQRIALANSAGAYCPLTEATPAEIDDINGTPSNNAAQPAYYCVDGDQVQLLPQPSVAALNLRMSYYLRPSRLVTSQSSTLGGDAVIRGRITSIAAIASRQVTVDVIPFDQELATPAVLTSGSQRIDIVHPDGWFELALVGATQTFSGLVFTIGGTDSLADVRVGDFVRVAEQTDWPCLPEEFHQTLCDATAMRLCDALNYKDKSAVLARKIGLTPDGQRPPGTDLARLVRLLTPRVQTSPRVMVRRSGILAGAARPRFWGAQ